MAFTLPLSFLITSHLSHWCQPSPLGRICSVLLVSDFVGEKREKIKQKT
jgi:hypothetical protein